MCRIEHNHAGDSGGGVFVYPSSTLTVEDSVIFDNEALGGGGGVALSGGLSGAWLTARNTAWEQNRANSTLGGALYCFNSTATLVDCRLAGNDAWNGGAVYASDTNLTMVNALVTGNRATAGVPATGRGGGVYATGSGTMTLVNGTFSGNLSAEGGGAIHAGMFLLEMSNCVAWNNSALGSTAHPNASIGGVTTFLLNIRNNLMQNLDLTSDGPGNFDGTLASNDPLFATPLSPASAPSTLGDFHLQSTSPILHAGDNAAVSEPTDLDGNPRILGPAVDLGAYERAGIVYVDASATGTGDGLSWPDAFTTLQAALAFVAGSGVHDEIWIAEGTYVPNPYDFGGGPQGFAVGVSVSLRGGFPTGGSGLDGRDFVAHPTVLDATGTNGRVFTINDGNDAVERVVLFDGLVVRGGTAYEDGISPVGQARGGGIYCRENLTLRDVSLTNNTADFLGGGICLDHGSATIEACTIRDNTASGRSISAAIGYAGGGIYAEAGTVLDLTDSEILSNQTVYSNARGAGVCVLAGSTLSAERCRFAGNHGKDRGGAIYAYQATLAFDTCAFTGNTGWEGGAIYQDQLVSCTHVNGTFAGNGSVLTTNGTGDGGAIVVNGTSATLLNTLVWGNQSALAPDTATASILVRNGGSFTADHCLAQHLDLVGHGSGNIDGTLPGHDPLMVAPLDPAAAPSEAGDFRLNIGSMCLDSGDASASNSATDLAGGPRIVSSEIDMGAYEGPLSVRTDVHLFRPDFDSDFLNVANWQSAGTPTPAAMVTGHFYIVLGDANLNASSSLSGVLRIDPAVQLTVGAGGGLVVTGAGSLLVSGTLANTPEITVSGSSSLDLAGGTLTGPVFSLGTSRVSGSGTLGGVVVFEGGDIKGSGTLTVSGLLRTSGAGATSIEGPLLLDNSVPDARVLQIDPGSTLQNAGGVTFQSGEAMVRGTWQHNQTLLEVLAGATLSGDGTVSGGNVDVYGRAEPGPDTGYGDLHIQGGGFTHYNGATTRIEVGGNGAGEFDRILVTGQAALGGTLLVDFAERPLAEPGSYVFLVPTSGYMFGYTTRTPVNLAPTRGFSYTYGSASDRFTISSTGSPYQDWAFASGLTAGVNDDPFFDANDDGVPNIQHYAYDTDPLGGGGTEGKQRTSIVENGGIHYFALTLPIRRGAVFSGTPSPTAGIDGVFVTIQGSLDLQTWDELVFPLLPADSAGLPPLRDIDGDGTADWEYRTFIFYDHLPPKRFLRAMTQLAPP